MAYLMDKWKIPRGKMSNSQGNLSHPLKYHFQAKKRKVYVVGGGWLQEVARKSRVNQGKVVSRFQSEPSSSIRFSCDFHSANSYWYREGDTLTNEDFFYKCKLPFQKSNFPVFRAPTCLIFLKIINSKQSVCQRGIFWGDILCYPSPASFFVFHLPA